MEPITARGSHLRVDGAPIPEHMQDLFIFILIISAWLRALTWKRQEKATPLRPALDAQEIMSSSSINRSSALIGVGAHPWNSVLVFSSLSLKQETFTTVQFTLPVWIHRAVRNPVIRVSPLSGSLRKRYIPFLGGLSGNHPTTKYNLGASFCPCQPLDHK